uniref:KNOX1 domain-containing protein n=1 Tax=Lactuca sativa TaxID=4236 RepID=A0A9R1VGX2_LACSA|nr:hypothetical protein LSAT_V11C500234430 [Lactuca sativa]
MNYHEQIPPAETARENYHHAFDDQAPDVRHQRTIPAVFGSGSNIQTSSSNKNNNNGLAEELDEDLSSANRAKIMSHPLYPKLLQAYISCQKVGAPPDIANLFDEIFSDNDFCRRSSACSCLGDDPELDEFMVSQIAVTVDRVFVINFFIR